MGIFLCFFLAKFRNIRIANAGFIDVAAIAILILVSAAITVPLTYFANKSTTENRSYAAISCGGGTCPDGWSYGSDANAPQSSCAQRAAEACAGHQASAPAPQPPAPAPAPGSCTSTGCTYYSCTEQLLTNSCGARVRSIGFCRTNYPATDPCKVNTAPAPPAGGTTTPPTTGGTTPTNNVCPSGKIQCGGCLNNLCYPATDGTCNVQIQNKCNTSTTCAGNGVAPSAGQTCCSPYVLYSNGRCGPATTAACISAGGSKPVGSTTPCCTGTKDCGTSCAAATATCPSTPATSVACTAPNKCVATASCTLALGGTAVSSQTCSTAGQVCCLIQAVTPHAIGDTCVIGTDCTTGYCNPNKKCQTPPAIPISPGGKCTNASGCTCADTGRLVANGTSCPAQLAADPGKVCPAGNLTCTCIGGTTVNGGEKCPATNIKAGAPCPSDVCTCTGSSGYVLKNQNCPTLSSGASCSLPSECSSHLCSPNGVCSTACTIGGKSVNPGSTGCQAQGDTFEILCGDTSSTRRNCASGLKCIGTSCQPTPKPIAKSCSLTTPAVDLAAGDRICETEKGSTLISCSLTGVTTKTTCSSTQYCVSGACVAKPAPLAISCTAALCTSVNGCTCGSTCVSPGLKAFNSKTPCGGIKPVTTTPSFACTSATAKGCSGNVAQQCHSVGGVPTQTDCGSSKICDRTTGTCISPAAGTGAWTCNTTVASNATRDSYTSKYCDPEAQWKYDQGLSSGKSCGGSASVPKNADGSSCLKAFTCPAGQWQCGNDCATPAIQSTFNANYVSGQARWKYEAGLNQGISCGGSPSTPIGGIPPAAVPVPISCTADCTSTVCLCPSSGCVKNNYQAPQGAKNPCGGFAPAPVKAKLPIGASCSNHPDCVTGFCNINDRCQSPVAGKSYCVRTCSGNFYCKPDLNGGTCVIDVVVPPPVVKPPQVLKCTIGATGCFTSNQEKVCIATSTGSDWAYSTCSVGSSCNAPNTRCTKNAVSSTPTECNPLNCVPTATECSLNNGVVDSQKSCLGGLTGVCCSVAMKQQIPTLVAGQMCLAGLEQCNCPKQNGQNVSVPGGVRCPKLADGNACTNPSQCITNVCNVTCGGVTTSTNSAQCMFGVSSCSAVGKYPSTSCSICPSGVASCCGDTIPASEIKCQIGSSSCVNATTVRACTPTATGYDFKTFACASGVCSSTTNKCVAPQPASTTPKTCVQITDAMTCGYTPNCTWNNNRCAEKTVVATYDLGTCTTPCPISGACFCPTNCNKASISLGTGGTCGGQKVSVDCTKSTNRISCALNSSCNWVSSSFFASGICVNKPTPITSCTQVCDSTTGMCQCPQSCSNASTTPNGLTCGGTKVTTTCPAGQWQCGNQCADGATQSSFNSVWCNGKGRWLSESQSNQRVSIPGLICSGADASIQKTASTNCTSTVGVTSACSQYADSTASCQAVGHTCQYDTVNRKCIPLICIADGKVKPSNTTSVCCSGATTYNANGFTYCGPKPKVLPTPIPTAKPDPSTVCEKNNGNQSACTSAGCQYYADTKSCVIKGQSNICQGGAGSCDFGGKVGSPCTDGAGAAGVCGRSGYTAADTSCVCKNRNFPITINVGQSCPKTGGACVCADQFVAAGTYCHPTIQTDDYCRDSQSCYCRSSGVVIPFGAQCRPFPPGFQQWVDRTNALRKSCSTGASTVYDCAVLGIYQLADALVAGTVDSLNTDIQAYIACTQELVAGRRTDCLKESIAVGTKAPIVADFFLSFAKLLITLPKSISSNLGTGATLDQANAVIPNELLQDIRASSGHLTPAIFEKDFALLAKMCPPGVPCNSKYEVYVYFKQRGLISEGADAFGITVSAGTTSGTATNPIFSGVADGTSDRVATTWANQIAKPGELVVDAHGWPWPNGTYRFEVQTVSNGEVQSTLMDAEEFAQYLVEGGYVTADTKGVVLVTCFAAACPTSGASTSLASQLAKELQLPVTAAADKVGTVDGVAAFFGNLSTFAPDGSFSGYRLMSP